MPDYEQLYFDTLNKLRKKEKELEITKQELELHKKENGVKTLIIQDFTKYLKNNKIQEVEK